jgi:hypothetical protein
MAEMSYIWDLDWQETPAYYALWKIFNGSIELMLYITEE